MSVIVRLGTAADLPDVAQVYREWGYRSAARPEDMLVVAEHDRCVVGVVRLATEYGHRVLRGMRVLPAYQRTGIGTHMLELLVSQLEGRACFAIPYDHLLPFYGRVGFRRIKPSEAPAFLAEREASYRSDGLSVCIIHRPGGASADRTPG